MTEIESGYLELFHIPIKDGKVNEKPVVYLPGNGTELIDTAAEVFTKIAPYKEIFHRGGYVVETRTNNNNVLVLDIVTPEAFRTRAEKYCFFVVGRKSTTGGPSIAHRIMPNEVAKTLLHSLESRIHLPKITGLINCPIIRIDENELRIVGKGYDPISELLITEGETPNEISLAEAVESLKLILSEFDFATPSDKTRAHAAIITPALKFGGILKGNVPAIVAEADQSQSGKTYLFKILASIYGEIPAFVTKRTGGVGSIDETLAEHLVSGRPFILYDNFRGKLDDPHLESFLTAGSSFPARVPHKGSIEVDPSRFIVMLSSNGVETTPDFANRSLFIRIKKKPSGYHFKKYPEGDLLDHVKAQRTYLQGCIFAVINHWFDIGMPSTSETKHDFREWAQILDWIVQNTMKEPALLDGHRQAQARVSNLGLSFLRQICIAVETISNFEKEPFSATDIFDLCQDESIDVPGLSESNQDNSTVGGQRIGLLLKPVFKDKNEVNIDNFIITKTEKSVPRDGGKGDRKITAYIFSKKISPQILLPGSP